MHLDHLLRSEGGIARTSRLVELGCGRRELAARISSGRYVRPQRGWVALPETDPDLLFAAEQHVVLSCITQAERIGLWVTDRHPVRHVAAPHGHAKIRGPSPVVHWHRALVPRPAFALEDPIENLLHSVALCQPREEAVVIWESALNRGHTDYAAMNALPLNGVARRVLDSCTPFSDSGLETKVKQRLRWLGIPIREQSWVLGRRVDLLIGNRLVIQIDGAHHTGAQRDSDIAHDAQLGLRGYRVIRVSYHQVMREWEFVQQLIVGAIARGEHLAK